MNQQLTFGQIPSWSDAKTYSRINNLQAKNLEADRTRITHSFRKQWREETLTNGESMEILNNDTYVFVNIADGDEATVLLPICTGSNIGRILVVAIQNGANGTINLVTQGDDLLYSSLYTKVGVNTFPVGQSGIFYIATLVYVDEHNIQIISS